MSTCIFLESLNYSSITIKSEHLHAKTVSCELNDKTTNLLRKFKNKKGLILRVFKSLNMIADVLYSMLRAATVPMTIRTNKLLFELVLGGLNHEELTHNNKVFYVPHVKFPCFVIHACNDRKVCNERNVSCKHVIQSLFIII